MAATFQKTLYRQEGAQWRYTRLRWLAPAQGLCLKTNPFRKSSGRMPTTLV
jgi:hypothetical protein